MNHRVYDSRTDESLFVGSKIECLEFLNRIPEDDEMFEYAFLDQ